MDPLTITLSVIGIIVTVSIAILKRIRDSDLIYLKSIKEEFEDKLKETGKQTDKLYSSVQAKLDKDDYLRTLERLDKELYTIRENQKNDLNRIELKIDNLLNIIMSK